MAYPTVSAPYGLKPVNLVGGQVFAGATTKNYPIQYGYATDIFYGDIVNLTRGSVTKNTDTTDSTQTGIVGVFLGVSYTNPYNKQKQFAQYWPAGTAAGDAQAIICDDPDTVFKVVMCSATTVIASASTAMLGQNFGLIQNSGNVNTGDSAVAALYSASTTGVDLALRVVGLVPETAVVTSATGSSSSTTITCSALPNALVVGTEVGYIAANGQYIQSGSYVSSAAAAGATSVTINSAIAVPGAVTAIPSNSTIVFTQYPEMLVKLNFGTHSYYTGTAV
jgi:hypothetical protein